MNILEDAFLVYNRLVEARILEDSERLLLLEGFNKGITNVCLISSV